MIDVRLGVRQKGSMTLCLWGGPDWWAVDMDQRPLSCGRALKPNPAVIGHRTTNLPCSLAQPSPTIGQCINGALEVECRRCKTRASIPLDAIRLTA
jgi:hypothetical protein